MRILITGFTPFDNESINPSWEIAQSVHAPEGVELVRLQINVELIKKRSDITSEKIYYKNLTERKLVIGYIHMMTLSVLGLLNEYRNLVSL
ncbi:hypothetical protein gvb03_01285 [Gardnerella vaginalis]|nr:hypothetical protein gvb02_04405 [Gardnerella vaginalis]RDW98699.1 hypothetical protein gvb03_01285 [Gardnerella vaginalis]